MYILTVTYPNDEGATFDHDYYRNRHLPLVGKAFQPFGLGYASVLVGEKRPDGTDPAFLVQATFSFETEEGAKKAVMSDMGGEVRDDIAKFTTITPIIQFNTSVE